MNPRHKRINEDIARTQTQMVSQISTLIMVSSVFLMGMTLVILSTGFLNGP